MPFAKHVRDAAQRFLRTAVVIDDEASLDHADPHAQELIAPTPRSAAEAATLSWSETAAPRETLDAKAMVDAFAELGLICGVLKPTRSESEKPSESLVKTASRADLVVLDWVLGGDGGEAALRLIEHLVDSDHTIASGRLRLIAIYTTEPHLGEILAAVRDRLGERVDECSNVEMAGASLQCGGLTLIVFAKEGTMVAPDRLGDVISVHELPKVLVKQFAQLTDGIIPAFVLNCLAAIRENSHHLLRRFHPGLDAPFLSHRCFTDPVDAEEFAVNLMALELRGLLAANEVRRYVSQEVVDAWIAERVVNESYELLPGKPISKDEFRTLLSEGRDEDNPPEGIKQKPFKNLRSLTPLFHESSELAERSDHEMARLSSLSRDDPDHFRNSQPPVLTLGTIVRMKVDPGEEMETPSRWRYSVCVQPACDALRLSGRTKFAFIPLDPVEPSENFEFVAVGPDQERLYFAPAVGVRDLMLIEFKPDIDQRVRATARDGRFIFEEADDEDIFWVAQLREFQGQRLANQLAGLMGRPGVDEYEWLRKSAGRH